MKPGYFMKNKYFRSFLSSYNSLIISLISFLGFAGACRMVADEYGPPPSEYGTPYARFIVKGTVSSVRNPLQGIRVVMENDTTVSDSLGKYQVSAIRPAEIQNFLLKFEDIDGQQNGLYKPLDTVAEFNNPIFNGGNGYWDQGEVEKEMDINLIPQNNDGAENSF